VEEVIGEKEGGAEEEEEEEEEEAVNVEECRCNKKDLSKNIE
jgi:hypothetical protein